MFLPSSRCDGPAATRVCWWAGSYKKAATPIRPPSGVFRQTGFANRYLFTVLILSWIPYVGSEQLVIRYEHHRRPAAIPRVRIAPCIAHSIQHTRILFLALVHQVVPRVLLADKQGTGKDHKPTTALGTQLPGPKSGTVRAESGSGPCHRDCLLFHRCP
jgi:hypothetical protein